MRNANKCPHCKGNLNSDYKWCPFCGENLNQKNRNNKQVIADAIENIEDAKLKLKQRESNRQNRKDNMSWGQRAMLVLIGLYVMCIIGVAIEESFFHYYRNKTDELQLELIQQKVETVKIDPIDIENIELTDVCSTVGYNIEESHGVLKLTICLDSENNRCDIYVNQTGLEEHPTITSDSTRYNKYDRYLVEFKYENEYVPIQILKVPDYGVNNNNVLDILDIDTPKQLDGAVRYCNVELGVVVFEQYNRLAIAHLGGEYFLIVYSEDVDKILRIDVECANS